MQPDTGSYTTKLGVDSREYEILTDAVMRCPSGYNLVCEIGVREGGSSELIMECLSRKYARDLLVLIDQYGGMTQIHSDDVSVVLDYTNSMRNKALSALYEMAEEKKVNFQFFNLSDQDFFDRFKDGVPVYSGSMRVLLNTYAMVHLDGPHSTASVLNEVNFFAPKIIKGGYVVIDDIGNFNISEIENTLFSQGFVVGNKGEVKASYRKE